MALNASSVSLAIERSELTLAVLEVYADMSGMERKVERQRRGKVADRVRPEAQWSGVKINSPSLHHRESASLDCSFFTKLASLVRREKLAESRGGDLSRRVWVGVRPSRNEKARVPAKVRGRWWVLRSVLVRQHQRQSGLRVVNVQRGASGDELHQLRAVVVVANVERDRQAVGVAVAA